MAHPDYIAWKRHVEKEKNQPDRLPDAMSYEEAKDQAYRLIRDFSDEPSTSVVTIFEYESGYQIDAITEHPEFELYRDLYDGKDVKAIVFIKGLEIQIKEMQ
jgi:hypothetical protein